MRPSLSQRQRTQDNPVILGSFGVTSLRLLKGVLGPTNQLVGFRDTNTLSNGGFGGGTYNHWFEINLTQPCGTIITAKGDPRPGYIQTGLYDLNRNPIQEQKDLDQGAYSENVNIYFLLPASSYLLCVSTTRNESLEYTLGLIIEFPNKEPVYLLETGSNNFLIYENSIDTTNTVKIGPTFSVNYSLPVSFNGFTNSLATINSLITVIIPETSLWLIADYATDLSEEDNILFDMTENFVDATFNQHSSVEWAEAWERDHQQDDRFPNLFLPLLTS